jgi:hypothetical protein
MAWMVSIVLILFYAVGRFAFHETSLIGTLPFLALMVLVVDFLLAGYFRKKSSTNNSA